MPKPSLNAEGFGIILITALTQPPTMTPAYTKYLTPTMECLARLYNGEPVQVIRLRACLAGKGYTEFTGAYRGLNLGIKLGLIREVPISRKRSHYEPTPIGLVKGGVLDAVSEAYGPIDDTALKLTDKLTEYLFYSILIELPTLITASIMNPRKRGLTITCCDTYNRCFTDTIIPTREEAYYSMLTIKLLAGIPINGLRPGDYSGAYYFAKLKILRQLQKWKLANTPRGNVNPIITRVIRLLPVAQQYAHNEQELNEFNAPSTPASRPDTWQHPRHYSESP